MNALFNERGLLRTWSVVNVVSNEQVCNERGLL